jgi:hypothetical protein
MRRPNPLFVLSALGVVCLLAGCKSDAEIGNAFDDADGSSGSGESGDGDGDATGDGDGDSDGDGAKFDLNAAPDIGGCQAECGSEFDFSYIWIANHTLSTISKINTITMEEEGRYLTRADGNGSPSRTSVSLSGRKVAVANRNGGVTAFWAQDEFCDEMANGQAGLQTSGGADDVLAWADEDCRAWVNDFTGYTTQRPIAWAPTDPNSETCEYDKEEVWTSGCNKDQHEFIQVHLLDGNDGSEIKSTAVEGFNCVDGGYNYGGYGGAVDADGNLWIGNQTGTAKLARIDYETAVTEVYAAPVSPYGIAVDHEGRPWLTMELLQGMSLQARVKLVGRPGDAARAREVMRVGWYVADALHYIHLRGLVHRDLKSDNVVVLPDGRVKLLDFGIAQMVDALDKSSSGVRASIIGPICTVWACCCSGCRRARSSSTLRTRWSWPSCSREVPRSRRASSWRTCLPPSISSS